MSAVGATDEGTGYCSSCFTGDYPVPLGDESSRNGQLIKLRMTDSGD
jgi:hypothetical protein